MGSHLGQFDIISNLDVANVIEARRLCDLLECILAIFDFWVVWRNAIANESVGYGKLLVHVHYCILVLVHQPVGSIEACRAGADDGNTKASPCTRCCGISIAEDYCCRSCGRESMRYRRSERCGTKTPRRRTQSIVAS